MMKPTLSIPPTPFTPPHHKGTQNRQTPARLPLLLSLLEPSPHAPNVSMARRPQSLAYETSVSSL